MSTVFIGMPVYNGELYIREALDSILSQTYKNWHLYILDDCSTDNTEDICKEYSSRDERISYNKNLHNVGIFENYGLTLKQANGDYFMWAAQDDIREPSFIETCINCFNKDPSLGLVMTGMVDIYKNGNVRRSLPWLVSLSGRPGIWQISHYVLQQEIKGKCNLMYGLFRTEYAREAWFAYPHRKVWGPDYHFSLAAVARMPVYVVPEILFKKRLGGYSDSKTSEKPRSGIFPLGRFKSYLDGHLEAVHGTPWSVLVFVLLCLRLPHAIIWYVLEHRPLNNIFYRK